MILGNIDLKGITILFLFREELYFLSKVYVDGFDSIVQPIKNAKNESSYTLQHLEIWRFESEKVAIVGMKQDFTEKITSLNP